MLSVYAVQHICEIGSKATEMAEQLIPEYFCEAYSDPIFVDNFRSVDGSLSLWRLDFVWILKVELQRLVND